ncbi:MAG: DUF4230 domain-containing protein [Sphingomonadaceae bacterium]
MRMVLAVLAGFALAVLLALFVVPGMRDRLGATFGLATDARATAEAVLDSVRREQKLAVFSARLIVDSSATYVKTAAGFDVPGTAARRTVIVPGRVTYVLDLSRLSQEDLAWDEARATLTVARPPVETLEPAVEIGKARIFDERGLLSAFTSADRDLDELTRGTLQAAMLAQARERDLLELAETAADEALRRTFELPLHAAGFERARVQIVRRDQPAALPPVG